LSSREGRRLRVFEHRVLRRIFGPNRIEVTEGWGGLHHIYSSSSIIIKSRRMRWAGHDNRNWERRNIYSILVGKTEVKRSVRRRGLKWVDNTKMDLG
jgi:hypothetical protein